LLRTIHLHGALRRACGGPYTLDVETAGEAVRALALQLPGFAPALKPRAWRVIRGDRRAGARLGPIALSMKLGNEKSLHIVPAVAGADTRGVGTAEVIVGVTLLALAIAAPELAGGSLLAGGLTGVTIAGIPAGAVALTGLALALAGAQALSAKTPDATTNDRSFLLHGNTNTAQDGDCVPICVGRFRYPPKLISAGLTSSRVPIGYVPPTGTGVNGAGGGPGGTGFVGTLGSGGFGSGGFGGVGG